jgi:hypothetical protein
MGLVSIKYIINIPLYILGVGLIFKDEMVGMELIEDLDPSLFSTSIMVKGYPMVIFIEVLMIVSEKGYSCLIRRKVSRWD